MKGTGFCIYIDTVCEGAVPAERDQHGHPIVYSTSLAAEHVIAEDAIDRLQQFLMGEREFEDALTVEEFVVEVEILADGSILDADGKRFGAK